MWLIFRECYTIFEFSSLKTTINESRLKVNMFQIFRDKYNFDLIFFCAKNTVTLRFLRIVLDSNAGRDADIKMMEKIGKNLNLKRFEKYHVLIEIDITNLTNVI